MIKLTEMIKSFADTYNVINPDIFDEMVEKAEIILDQMEITGELTVKERIETAVQKVISELIKL
jgi:hypothetical protein